MKKHSYQLKGTLWLYPGESANWHFLTLPKTVGQQIKEAFSGKRRGFGSLRVSVTVGKTTWQTSIFPDTSAGSYVLPVKASVRKAEGVEVGDTINYSITVL